MTKAPSPPKMRSKTWKAFEGRVAASWGCLRNVLSGSSNRADRDPSDTTHERLHIECKLHRRQEVWSVWDKAKKAARGNKVVVLALGSPHRHGWITAFHSDDTEAFVKEWLAANATLHRPPSEGGPDDAQDQHRDEQKNHDDKTA